MTEIVVAILLIPEIQRFLGRMPNARRISQLLQSLRKLLIIFWWVGETLIQPRVQHP